MKKFAGFTREQVEKELKWVVKFVGWRKSGTIAELKWFLDNEEIRDMDLASKEAQTPDMQKFMDAWEAIEKQYGFTPLPELFEKYGQ